MLVNHTAGEHENYSSQKEYRVSFKHLISISSRMVDGTASCIIQLKMQVITQHQKKDLENC